MIQWPRAGAGAGVAGQVVGDHHDGPVGVGGLDGGQQLLVADRVARRCGHRHLVAVTDAERAVHPGVLRPAAIVQHGLDAVAIERPAGGGREAAGDDRAQLVGADHRRLRRRGGGAGDDLRSFGTNSGSGLCVHERGCRQRTPSASRIRRTWLQAAGGAEPARAMIRPRSCSVSRRGRPGRGRSASPSTPWVWLKRRSHLETVLGWQPSRWARPTRTPPRP
jgi:hypothetical protein